MVSSGYISLLYSIDNKPLKHWSKQQSQSGRVRKILDSDLLEDVIELQDLEKSSNANTFIACPAFPQQLLGVRLSFLVIVVKNMSVPCRFQVQVVDTDDVRHHFHFYNKGFVSEANVRAPVISRVEMKLEMGWNRVELDLEHLTQQAFHSRYKATQRVAICANCRLRRIYFIDKHYADREISTGLCQDFFHHYMLKCEDHLDELKKETADTSEGEKIHNSRNEFFTKIQIKSGKLINNFFSKSNARLPGALDFKNKMRLMLFAFPRNVERGIVPIVDRNDLTNRKSSGTVEGRRYRMTPTGKKIALISSVTEDRRMELDQHERKNTDTVSIQGDWYSRYHIKNLLWTNSMRNAELIVSRKKNQKTSGNASKTRSLQLKYCKELPTGENTSSKVVEVASGNSVTKSNADGTLDSIREISTSGKAGNRYRPRNRRTGREHELTDNINR